VLGLIVNPVAGLGGRVGLKGSDGLEVQALARRLGAIPVAPLRTTVTLERLQPHGEEFQLVTGAGDMGEVIARQAGFAPAVLPTAPSGATTAADTLAVAREMQRLAVDLILFAGGDGTACDLVRAIGETTPCLGIPAGVKILSAAFATTPVAAGDLALRYLRGEVTRLQEVEVLDLDEVAYRDGRVSPRLFGYLRIPFEHRLVQGRKSPSRADPRGILEAIAADILDNMQDDVAYVVGPGTTTRPILTRLGLEKTLVGVDVLRNRGLLASDANEARLLDVLTRFPGKIVVTPIGGQGYLFGRGNQQISPAVIRRVGRENLLVASSPEKIHALHGRPLLVDTGDSEVDHLLSGYVRVITGYNERIVYRVTSFP
jgi:predicted polyphosphate/ATP-dependent NAD kinase